MGDTAEGQIREQDPDDADPHSLLPNRDDVHEVIVIDVMAKS